MGEAEAAVTPASDQKAPAPGPKGPSPWSATVWLKEIERAKAWQKKWFDRSTKIVERYRDERENEDKANRFNILYSNTEVLKGSLYQKTPKPVVISRYRNPVPAARCAAMVIERAVEYSCESYDFDNAVMMPCVEDKLLPGRGQAVVKYKPVLGMVQVGDQQVEDVVSQSVYAEYVEWDFYLHQPARRYDQVMWHAYGVLLTRQDCVDQFGTKVGNLIQLTWKPKDASEEDVESMRALVWKVWDKRTRTVVVVTEGYKDDVLRREPDPLHLEQFFPNPKPLYSVTTTNSLIPVPEYVMYQDQAEEMDILTARITHIIDCMRRRGWRDAGVPELEELANAGDNVFVPVQNLSQMKDKGGLKGVMETEDVQSYAKVLEGLYAQREAVKQTIYEVTGLSDIIRGASIASETATAQRIKAQYSSIRITPQQKAVGAFARDLFRLKAELIAEHFSERTLADMTGINPEEYGTTWAEVMALLKDQKLRNFKIEIETDITIAPDEQADKEAATEFITAFGQMMAQVGPAMQEGYLPPEVAKALTLFAARKFRASREVETALEMIGQNLPQKGMDEETQKQLEEAQKQIQQAQEQVQKEGESLQQEKQQLEADKMQLQMDKMQVAMDKQALQMQEKMAGAQVQGDAQVLAAKQEVVNTKAISKIEQLITKFFADLNGMQAESDAKQKANEQAVNGAAETISQNNEGMAKMMEGMQQSVMDAVQEAVSAITAPKEVVRDANGTVIGIKVAASKSLQ